jgi:hypothetical protein
MGLQEEGAHLQSQLLGRWKLRVLQF